MKDQYFGMKEIYQVALKATNSMTIGSRAVLAGEPVTYFNNIQISLISEYANPIYARGGKGNEALVVWLDRSDITFKMTSGVLSDMGLSLLTNSKVLNLQSGGIPMPVSLIANIDELGKCALNKLNICLNKPVFCFLYLNGIMQLKIVPTSIDYYNGIITFDTAYKNKAVVIDYYFSYLNERKIYVLLRQRFSGVFTLLGKFYRKGEQDGINRTTLFRMPKVKIMSNINITLGTSVSPATSDFTIIAMPYATDYSKYSIMEMYNFDEEVC